MQGCFAVTADEGNVVSWTEIAETRRKSIEDAFCEGCREIIKKGDGADDAEAEDERGTDWKRGDRRRETGGDPVHDKYEDRRCKGNSGTDPQAGSGRL